MLMRSTFLINQATHTYTHRHIRMCVTYTRCVKPHPVWVNVFMVEVIELHILRHTHTHTYTYICACMCGRYASLAASNSIVLVGISHSQAGKLNNCILSLKFDSLCTEQYPK